MPRDRQTPTYKLPILYDKDKKDRQASKPGILHNSQIKMRHIF